MTTSTLIPSIGMTFAEAAERVRELVEAYEAVEGEDSAAEMHRNDLRREFRLIYREIMLAAPRTLSDILAILDRLLCPFQGIAHGIGKLEVDAIQRIRTLTTEMLASAAKTEAPGGQQPANDEVDPLDAAAAMLDYEAAGPLALPQSPSDAMAEAGAAVLGITPDAFRAAYSAAADAHAKEKAA